MKQVHHMTKRIVFFFFTSCMTLLPTLVVGFDEQAYSPKIQARILKTSGLTDDGKPIHYPIGGQAEVSSLQVTIPPGAKTGWHYHPAPGFAFVISGTLEIELNDGTSKYYKQGDVIYEVIDRVHQGVNTGDVPVEMIAIFTGIKGQNIAIKTSAPSEQTTTVP